ncbi:MAG: hypothetical protein V3T70_07900, partial [Phycisphaerae bacterium]
MILKNPLALDPCREAKRDPNTPRHSSATLLAMLGACCFLAGPAGIVHADEPPVFPPDQTIDCLHIKLELKVDIPEKAVQARAAIDVQAMRDAGTITLDAAGLDVSAVRLTRHERTVDVDFVNDGERLAITCDPPLAAGEAARIEVDYTLDDPATGLHFFGPTDAQPDVPNLVWSQGQAITNRYWFPCFDHPGERQTSELIVTAAKGNEVISNGKLLSRKENADGTVTFHWLQDKPHVAYLVTLVVGPFHLEEETWRGKPVRYYVHPKYKDDVRRSFGRTTAMLDFFSDMIGVE